jgi:hypothetical protein
MHVGPYAVCCYLCLILTTVLLLHTRTPLLCMLDVLLFNGVLQRPKGEMNTNVPTELFTDTDLNKGAPAGKQHVEGGGTRDRSIFAW